jgi:hypothetical protein
LSYFGIHGAGYAPAAAHGSSPNTMYATTILTVRKNGVVVRSDSGHLMLQREMGVGYP